MTDIIQDPTAAGEWLQGQEDLGKASFAFNQKYGEGAAEAVLAGTYKAPVAAPIAAPEPTVSEEQPEEDGDGWLMDTAKALVEGPVSAIREGLQSLNATGNQNLDPSDPAHYGLVRPEALQAVKGPIEDRRQKAIEDREETLNNISIFGAERDTIAGSLTQGMSQAVTGMLLTGGKSSITTVAGGITTSFTAGGIFFDPDEANFVRTLDEQFDIGSDLTTELLANDSDSEAVNRFQNAVTDGMLGIAGEGVVAAAVVGFKALRSVRKGKAEIADTGKLSPETELEIEAVQSEIKAFSDLQNKPKGKVVEGRFVTEDGLAFDTKSGARDVEFETAKLQEVQRVETPDAPTAPDVDAAPKAVDAAAKVVTDTTPPTLNLRAGELKPSSATVIFPKIEPVGTSTVPVKPKLSEVDKAFKSPLKPAQLKVLSKSLEDLDATPENLTKIEAELNEKLVLPSQFFEEGAQVEAVLKATSLSLQKSGVVKKLTDVQAQSGVLENAAKRLGDELDTDPDAFIGKLQALAGGMDEANEMATAARMYMYQTSKLMDEAISEVKAARAAKSDAPEATERYLNLVERHAAIQEAVQGIRSGTGRGLSLQKSMITEDLSEKSMSFLDSLGGAGRAGERAIELAEKLKAAKTDKARAALIRKSRTEHSKIWGMANELFMGGILSGFPTQMLNLAATTANITSRPVVRYMGAMVKGGKPIRQQAALEMVYAFTTLADSLRLLHLQGGRLALKNDFTDNPLVMAGKAFKQDRPVLDAQTKFGDADLAGRNAFSAPDSWVAPVRWMANGTGHTINIARRGLGTTDELLKQVSFRSQIKARAMMDAREMGADELLKQGFKSKSEYVQHHLRQSVNNYENLSERYRELVKTGRAVDDDDLRDEFIKASLGSANVGGKYTTDALTEARAATFTTPLEPDAFMKGAEKWANASPALKQIAPFIRTPTNVLRENFERLPVVNLFMKHLKRDLKSEDPSVRALARGKFIYGYTTAVLALGMAYNNKMTGAGPNWSEEPAEAKLWAENPNWQANSWVFDQPDGSKKFVDVSKLLPHVGAFTMVASINETLQRHHEEFENDADARAGIFFGSMIAVFAEQVTTQSAFSGAGEVMEILNGNGGWEAAQKWAEDRSVAMLPLSSYNYNANKKTDGMVRDTTDYIEKIKSRLPSFALTMYGATRDAPFKHNFLTGQPLDTPELAGGFLKKSKSNTDIIENEVFEELMKIEGGLTGPSKRLGQRKVSPEIHQRLNQLTGTTKIGGDTLMTALHKVINDPVYDKEAARIDYNVTPFRRNLLQSVVQSFKSKALEDLVTQYPELKDEINKLMEVDAMLKAGVMPDDAGFANRNGRLELPE